MSLIPYFIKDYIIDDKIISSLKDWYKAREHAEDWKKDRSDKASHFINLAMNAGGIESYINYFIALDAMYGERDKVEQSIKNGILACTGSDNWVERSEWLFNLRSELVHGGSRFISEWKDYESYRRYFKSLPSHDVEKLAFMCLLNYFG